MTTEALSIVDTMKLAISRLEWFVDAYPYDITTSKEDFLRPFKEALAQLAPVSFQPFEIETSIEAGGEIHQTITDLAGKVMLNVLDTQENDVRKALIQMGWTPPQPAQRKPLTDEQLPAMWAEAVRKAALPPNKSALIHYKEAIEAAHGIKE